MRLSRFVVLLFSVLWLGAGQTVKADAFKLPARNTLVSLKEIEAISHHYELTNLWQRIVSTPPDIPFSSDGCSLWPDNWFEGQDLYEACFIHDLQYWAGIPGDEMGRLQADVQLMLWVAEHVSIELAEAMFNGVRVGGSEKLDTPWRWGYGRVKSQEKRP